TARALAEQKRITLLIAPVDSAGRVDPAWIGSHLNSRTILVSVMWINNEIGTVQDIAKISEVIGNFRKESKKESTPYPLFHTDAVQAFQYSPVDVSLVSVDLLTLAGHKIYAPKGVGLLYVRNGTPLTTQTAGGGQERGLRSGTESVPLALALSLAMERAAKLRAKESARLRTLHGAFVKLIKSRIKNTRIISSAAHGSPHIISVLIDHISADELLFLLDEAGIAASLGSACTTGKLEPSRVLSAMGINEDSAPLRLSMGRETRMSDIRTAVSALTGISAKFLK
ncbi:MAG: aminotransferase class V-fold PLP-dependent enzyme, partial [bacterium]|nr:aminotransferase class V-fold PLP-dependent enzyme [bacterium]